MVRQQRATLLKFVNLEPGKQRDTLPPMKPWQHFENLVASIHRFVSGSEYEVETNVLLTEPSGGSHQIDVRLVPKSHFARPILISCKAWKAPVGVEHIREWSDIVQQTGAGSGVVVAEHGFTEGAIHLARKPERRLSLWTPRPLTLEDFAPDGDCPDGYVARVPVEICAISNRIVDGSFKLDAARTDGKNEGRAQRFSFGPSNRDLWFLRDEADNLRENLWDVIAAVVDGAGRAGEHRIEPKERRFLVLDGIRYQFAGAAFEIESHEHRRSLHFDILPNAMGYENAVTGEVTFVPLPHLRAELGRR